MSANNPKFQNVDRPAQELPLLIRALGEVPYFTQLSQDQCDRADAIKSHARNAHEVLLDGIASIGHLMMLAADGETELGNAHVLTLGALLTHLAVEADALRNTEADMRTILEEQQEMRSKASTPTDTVRPRGAARQERAST